MVSTNFMTFHRFPEIPDTQTHNQGHSTKGTGTKEAITQMAQGPKGPMETEEKLANAHQRNAWFGNA